MRTIEREVSLIRAALNRVLDGPLPEARIVRMGDRLRRWIMYPYHTGRLTATRLKDPDADLGGEG